LLKSVELEIMGFRTELDELKGLTSTLREHLLFTREEVIIKGESPAYLIYQQRLHVAEMAGMNKMMYEIHEDLGLRFISEQNAQRDLSRTVETLSHVRKYLDTSLKNNRTLKEQNLAFVEKIRDQDIQIKVKDQTINAYAKVVDEVGEILEERKAPSDVQEALERILREAPQPKGLEGPVREELPPELEEVPPSGEQGQEPEPTEEE
jgi:hypothetical protein